MATDEHKVSEVLDHVRMVDPEVIWQEAWELEQILYERQMTDYEQGYFAGLKHVLELFRYPYSEEEFHQYCRELDLEGVDD